MPLYKFYRIVPKDVSKTDCYIGHTIQPLRKRFKGHYDAMNKVGSGSCSSSILFRNYGKDALEIVLIHELELPDREFARREERRLYEEYKDRVVNKYKPHVSDEERKERDNLNKKVYYEANKDTIRPIKKLYREAHKVEHAIYNKRWREANAEAVKQKKNELQRQRRAYDAGLKYFARITIE